MRQDVSPWRPGDEHHAMEQSPPLYPQPWGWAVPWGSGSSCGQHITTAGKTRSFIKTLLVGIAVFSSQCSQLNPQGNCGALGMMCPR